MLACRVRGFRGTNLPCKDELILSKLIEAAQPPTTMAPIHNSHTYAQLRMSCLDAKGLTRRSGLVA